VSKKVVDADLEEGSEFWQKRDVRHGLLALPLRHRRFGDAEVPGKLFLGLFISGSPEEVEASMQIAYHYLAIMSLCLPVLYMLHIYRSALMGLGDTVVPMVSGFVEMVMRLGIAMLLPLAIGQEGIFYAEVGAWTGAAVLLVASYYVRINRQRE
jgi:Na+-driven multidrug efflux pump